MVILETLSTNMNIKQNNQNMEEPNKHPLKRKWVLWAHLPHNTDWSIKSYQQIATFEWLEEAIAVTENLTNTLVENCMLFLMLKGVHPTWEDPSNRNGGFFSYKVSSKNVYKCWKDITYTTVGESVSKDKKFVDNITGITISPKKNFCIVKIWMTDCSLQNPSVVSDDLKGLSNYGCLFKKHTPEY